MIMIALSTRYTMLGKDIRDTLIQEPTCVQDRVLQYSHCLRSLSGTPSYCLRFTFSWQAPSRLLAKLPSALGLAAWVLSCWPSSYTPSRIGRAKRWRRLRLRARERRPNEQGRL